MGPSEQVDEVADKQEVSQYRTVVVPYHHMSKQLHSLQYQNVNFYKYISQIIFHFIAVCKGSYVITPTVLTEWENYQDSQNQLDSKRINENQFK